MPEYIRLDKVVLDCRDPKALSEFYMKLLGCVKGYDTGDFIIIGGGAAGIDLGFQQNDDYVPPTWPEAAGKQQQMLHLDFAIKRGALGEWVMRATALGARTADTQYSDDYVVMLDPEGHPFCLDAT